MGRQRVRTSALEEKYHVFQDGELIGVIASWEEVENVMNPREISYPLSTFNVKAVRAKKEG